MYECNFINYQRNEPVAISSYVLKEQQLCETCMGIRENTQKVNYMVAFTTVPGKNKLINSIVLSAIRATSSQLMLKFKKNQTSLQGSKKKTFVRVDSTFILFLDLRTT